ncbi:MAG: Fic family protein [Ardenticatenaceae bacterium]
MRIPATPPSILKIISERAISSEKVLELLTVCGPTDGRSRYLHWDKLRYLKPPAGLTSEEVWVGTKLARQALLKALPLRDRQQQPFRFALPDSVLRMLYEIDQEGKRFMRQPISIARTKEAYLVSSLMEEAISSSQLEGASTTRKVAEEMLRQLREPKSHSEQMILNNYHAMHFVRENNQEDLTPSMIFELHRIVTLRQAQGPPKRRYIDDPDLAGRLRTEHDRVQVISNRSQDILHTPPNADELPDRLRQLCEFANAHDPNSFIHPIIKAILLHFMLAYDHPFVDGNGRTARALFYWLMARQGYWFTQFLSISRVIKSAPIQYGRAFLHTETDDNDTTYFIIHQLEVIKKAIDHLHQQLEKNAQELEAAEELLDRASFFAGQLNHRQLSLLKHALKHPNAVYTIKEHQTSHRVSYQTARTDLLKMADHMGLLRKRKAGKSFIFISPSDLKQRMESAS